MTAAVDLVLGRANLEEFAAALCDLAEHDPDIRVLTSDSRGSGKLGPFSKAFPAQIVEVGIAEQNLVGMAAGMASAGKKPFAVSPACFLTARALEQIKNDVAYSDQPVRLIGISAGVSYGALGTTHHSLHDYAVLRAINNLDIIAPADNFETRQAVNAAARAAHPVYIRFGKKPMYTLPRVDAGFQVGRASTILATEAADVTFIATGEPVYRAYQAALRLQEAGLRCRVISMHTVRPLDADALLAAAQDTRALITVEEHSVYGGLGEACAAVLMAAGVRVAFKIVGIPDEYTVTGSQSEIFNHYGISAAGLAATAQQLLG